MTALAVILYCNSDPKPGSCQPGYCKSLRILLLGCYIIDTDTMVASSRTLYKVVFMKNYGNVVTGRMASMYGCALQAKEALQSAYFDDLDKEAVDALESDIIRAREG